MKKPDLKWNVLFEDSNARQIRTYNVLAGSFYDNLRKAIKKYKIKNRSQLKEYLTGEFMYHYWCKSEFEIAVGGLFVKDISELEKIDVWYQLEMNLDNIVDYLISKMNLFKKGE